MVGSNLLSALKKKARRYSFSDRSPRRFYKGKADPSATPSPGASPPGKSKSLNRSVALGRSASQESAANESVASGSKHSTPARQISIQPLKQVDAASIDKPVPQLERRQPLHTQPQSKTEVARPELSFSNVSMDSSVEERIATRGDANRTPSSTHLGSIHLGALGATKNGDMGLGGVGGSGMESSGHGETPGQGFVLDPDVIGWSDSTTKMAGDAEALLEMELLALTKRYEVLMKRTEEKAKIFDPHLRVGTSGGTASRPKKDTKEEKKRLKEYEKKALEHAKKRLKAITAVSTNKDTSERNRTAEKSRQRWQRAKDSAVSMTPLQDQRGTKTNQMLRRLSMILRESTKESIYLNSPSPILDREKKVSPTLSGASGSSWSKVSLSLEELMGSSWSKKENASANGFGSANGNGNGIGYTPPTNETNQTKALATSFALELASAAKKKSVQVSLASMMAEAEALAKEVHVVTQGEQWTPDLEPLTDPPADAAAQSSGKPVGRNLLQEFGSRTGQKAALSLSDGATTGGVSSSASKTEDLDFKGPWPKHQRNASAPTIFTDLESTDLVAHRPEDEANLHAERSDPGTLGKASPQSTAGSSLEQKTPPSAKDKASIASGRKTTPISAMSQLEEDSPVTGLVVEVSEESVGSVPRPSAQAGAAQEGAAQKEKKASPRKHKTKTKRKWFACLPCSGK